MAATLSGLTGFASLAGTPDDSQALPDEVHPQWLSDVTLRGGGGYKDNVYLSGVQPIGSSFLSASAEALAVRFAPVGPQITLFGSLDFLHFLEGGAVHDELLSFNQARVEYEANSWLAWSLAGQYSYVDQILDVSTSETNRTAEAVRGHTLSALPGLKFTLPAHLWLLLEGPVTRQYFAEPLDDYWQFGPRATLGRPLDTGGELNLIYEPAWRLYDHEPALTTTGDPIPDSSRHRVQHDARLSWRQKWDAEGHWRTKASLGGRLVKENGGGYFDYTRGSASARIEYRPARWEISAEAQVAGYWYDHQAVSFTDQTLRRYDELSVTVHFERDLYKRLRFVAGYEYNRALSNAPLESYTVNTFSASLQWEF